MSFSLTSSIDARGERGSFVGLDSKTIMGPAKQFWAFNGDPNLHDVVVCEALVSWISERVCFCWLTWWAGIKKPAAALATRSNNAKLKGMEPYQDWVKSLGACYVLDLQCFCRFRTLLPTECWETWPDITMTFQSNNSWLGISSLFFHIFSNLSIIHLHSWFYPAILDYRRFDFWPKNVSRTKNLKRPWGLEPFLFVQVIGRFRGGQQAIQQHLAGISSKEGSKRFGVTT